jgi:hypothetical protein
MRSSADQGHDVADTDSALGPAAMDARDIDVVLSNEPPYRRAQRIDAFFRFDLIVFF